MKVGRNEPCPCGSGKKYKKCCLAKDEAAARRPQVVQATTQRELARGFELPPPLELPPPDPLTLARNELWEAFEAAKATEQPALFQSALADGELLDAEMAFEMLCAIRDHQDRAVFTEMLDLLEEQRPELYEHDASYYLDWRIGDALASGDLAALPALTDALAATAGKDLDTFYPVLERLAYHEQLALSARMMTQAWPHIGKEQELVPWAPDEFTQRAMDMTLFARVEQNPDLRPDDPELLAALEPFEPFDHSQLARYMALLCGRAARHWSLDDFAFQRRARSGWRDQEDDAEAPLDPAIQALDDLSVVFLGELHRTEGVSLAKGDLARKAIMNYILERDAGELEPRESPFDFGRQPKRQKPSLKPRRASPHLLCPDRTTLDHFIADMFNFISPHYYEAAATLELVPAWLRFLERHGLLTAEQHALGLRDLRKLVSDAAPVWESRTADPTIEPNIGRAWERAGPVVEEG